MTTRGSGGRPTQAPEGTQGTKNTGQSGGAAVAGDGKSPGGFQGGRCGELLGTEDRLAWSWRAVRGALGLGPSAKAFTGPLPLWSGCRALRF